MDRRDARSLTFTALSFVAAAGFATAQSDPATPAAFQTPRTSWGDPDLAGIYSNDDETGTPMERPDELEGLTLATITPEKVAEIVAERDRRFKAQVDSEGWRRSISPPPHLIFDTFDRKNKRPWLITDPVDGKIPTRTAEAEARPRAAGGVSTNQNSRGPFNSYRDMGLYDRCITRGIPNSMMPAGYGSRYEIVQAPDSVAIRYEMIHEARVIPLDRRPPSGTTKGRPPSGTTKGRPHVASSLKQYLGDARGWWDSDTLVVETTNFRAETAPQRSSENVKMIERFKRTAADQVEWTVTFEDASTWESPWTYSMPLTQVDHTQLIYEYACHEGNLAMRNILSGARAAEAAAAGAPRGAR
jgi:hypothetical protein